MTTPMAVRPAGMKSFKQKIYFFWIGMNLLMKIWDTHTSSQISESIDSMRRDWMRLGGIFEDKVHGEMMADIIQMAGKVVVQ